MEPATPTPQAYNFIGFHWIFASITKCLKVLRVSAPPVSNHFDLQTPELFPMNERTKRSKLKPTANICLSTAARLGPLYARALQDMDWTPLSRVVGKPLLLVSAEAWWPTEDTVKLPRYPSSYCLPPVEAAGAEGSVGFQGEGVGTKRWRNVLEAVDTPVAQPQGLQLWFIMPDAVQVGPERDPGETSGCLGPPHCPGLW